MLNRAGGNGHIFKPRKSETEVNLEALPAPAPPFPTWCCYNSAVVLCRFSKCELCLDISGKYLGEKIYFQINYVLKSQCYGNE